MLFIPTSVFAATVYVETTAAIRKYPVATQIIDITSFVVDDDSAVLSVVHWF